MLACSDGEELKRVSVSLSVIGASCHRRCRSWPGGDSPIPVTCESAKAHSQVNRPFQRQLARPFPVSSGTEQCVSTPVLGNSESLNQSFVTQAARKAFSPLPPLMEV